MPYTLFTAKQTPPPTPGAELVVVAVAVVAAEDNEGWNDGGVMWGSPGAD